ncbi:FAD/NAD(P)-binding oxidoreductase family protein [Senna tora]|uniref:FAD/NAD(P)-binding oxidoreductase family protein n=1 Tax=Senna tora TaxID=362788 RepID=A0A834WC25_9FABA|nr:FAD/NAD(P)-binding oxidoreductase family protein [Senna tora]
MVTSYSFSSSLAFQTLETPKSPFAFSYSRFRTLTCTSEIDTPKRKPKFTMDKQKSTSKGRKKSSYGTSRRSILKKTLNQEQVNFTAPISDDPVVGIIGGGMSGLICAMYLEKRGVRSTVFDTGIHGLGGRMGTRVIDPQPLIFDHAAQFFTVNDPRFNELLNAWLEKGLVQEWQGTIGELHNGGQFVPFPASPPKYIGTKGMRPLANSLLYETSMVSVVRPCWISKLEPFNGMWHLSENGKPCGKFDAIVIAHNGKCANRLLMSSGLPLIAKQMKRLELSSIWALLAAFDDPLPLQGSTAAVPFEGAFVKGVDSLSWMANNTKKLLKSQSGGPHCWTFLSTAAYGKQNKVPQENIPAATAAKVKAGMLEGVEAALGLSKGSLQQPFYTRLQLWGAALPTNTPAIPYIFDPFGRAGICGDWLLGSSVEASVLSGMALANHIADYFQNGGAHPSEFAVGLEQEFQPLQGHDIGQFPGLETQQTMNQTEMYQLVK